MGYYYYNYILLLGEPSNNSNSLINKCTGDYNIYFTKGILDLKIIRTNDILLCKLFINKIHIYGIYINIKKYFYLKYE